MIGKPFGMVRILRIDRTIRETESIKKVKAMLCMTEEEETMLNLVIFFLIKEFSIF